MRSATCFALAIALVWGKAQTLSAQFYIVNLSDDVIHWAVAEPILTASGSSIGHRYKGWGTLDEGKTLKFDGPQLLYLEQNGRPVAWPNLAKSAGFKQAQAFDEPVPVKYLAQIRSRLLSQGFQNVEYLRFEEGIFDVPGPSGQRAYRIVNVSHPISFWSDAFEETHRRDFDVPGTVIRAEFVGNKTQGAETSIDAQNDQVMINAVTRRATDALGGPIRGAIQGELRISYTERAQAPAASSIDGGTVFFLHNGTPQRLAFALSFRTEQGETETFSDRKTIDAGGTAQWLLNAKQTVQKSETANNRRLMVGVKAAPPGQFGGERLWGYGKNETLVGIQDFDVGSQLQDGTNYTVIRFSIAD
jgi:hypothetical protein